MRVARVYVDTSVFGGCFDKEFTKTSERLFEEIGDGRFTLVVSDTTLLELNEAPHHVQQVLAQVPDSFLEVVRLTVEVRELRDAYIDAGVVGLPSIERCRAHSLRDRGARRHDCQLEF